MSSLSGKQGPRYRHLAAEGEPYETISVEKLTPIIGAEIVGVDIGKLVSGEAPESRLEGPGARGLDLAPDRIVVLEMERLDQGPQREPLDD